MSLLTSLRGHSNAVTCIVIEGNTIFSGDDQGFVFEWDLISRRKKRSWAAHEGSTLISMQVIHKPQNDDLILLTHGRDSLVKFWDISSLDSSCNLNSVPLNCEFAVNSLNFCNVSYFDEFDLLLTPATTDSNNFDVYKFESIFPIKFSRLLHNIDPWELQKSSVVIDDDDISKRDKFGIMMKVIWVQNSTPAVKLNATIRMTSQHDSHDSQTEPIEPIFYIGYESGYVLGFKLELPSTKTIYKHDSSGSCASLINKNASVTLIQSSNSLVPSPILALEYEPTNNSILIGSSLKFLQTLSVPSNFSELIENDGVLTSLKHGGIAHLKVIDDCFVVCFWNGLTKCFNFANELLWQIERVLPVVENEANTRWKVTAMSVQKKKESRVNSNSNKDVIKSKRIITNKNLVALGYSNGSISIYQTK